MEQLSLFGDEEPSKDKAKQDKARSKAAENEEFKDKRQPKSPLIRQAEIERMKDILNMPKGGGGGGSGGMKSMKYEPKTFKAGGTASSRADGCAMRGKTRGKLV